MKLFTVFTTNGKVENSLLFFLFIVYRIIIVKSDIFLKNNYVTIIEKA